MPCALRYLFFLVTTAGVAIAGAAGPGGGPESELAAWLWPYDPDAGVQTARTPVPHERFDVTGVSVLHSDSGRAVVRGGDFRFRPSQADQANVELWIDGHHVVVDPGTWPRPAVFDWLEAAGGVERAEMYRTFNCGVGMVLFVAEGDVELASAILVEAGEQAWIMGRVEAGGTAPASIELA